MPSRYSAEKEDRGARHEMLQKAMQKGYFKGYEGVRISSTGKRFYIEDAVIFNLIDDQNIKVGQAATFSRSKLV